MNECSKHSHVNKRGLCFPKLNIWPSLKIIDHRSFFSVLMQTSKFCLFKGSWKCWCYLARHGVWHPCRTTLTVLLPACRFDGSESVVIVAAQKRTLGGRELQLPCMSSLTSKTSTQKFFLRVLQVIIQLREDTRRANKKAKQTGRPSEWDQTCWKWNITPTKSQSKSVNVF